MVNPHRCVIDSKKNYVTYVIVEIEDDKEIPLGYNLKKGEELLETSPPTGLKPQWTGKDWKELATLAELEAAEKANYEAMGLPWPPVPPAPTESEQLAMEFSTMMAMQQEQTEQAITELTMLIAIQGGI